MNQAENYSILFDGGNKAQAERLAENMCLSKMQDSAAQATLFLFEDRSAIYASGLAFRAATLQEIAAAFEK